jgi:flagellar assembly protein FliH
MSSTSRILREDELTSVTAIWWRDSGVAPAAAPEPKPPAETPNAAPPAPEADRERIEREAYQRGFSEGSALGKQQAGAELQPVLERLGKCLAELASMRSRMRRDGEGDLVKLSIAIARRVLHRELTLDPESIGGLIKVALDKLESRELSRVRAHPDQVSTIRALLDRYSSAKAEVVADTTLNKGDVLFETAHGALDASVDSQLREIERGLTDRLRK